jgi:hypothetical protein
MCRKILLTTRYVVLFTFCFVGALSGAGILPSGTCSAADPCECDLNNDGKCDMLDWLLFGENWGRTDCPPHIAAPVPKTGQTTSYATGDDGDLHKGVAWPNPRFTINGDGTVTDNLTGLMWLRDPNCILSTYPGFDNDDLAGDGKVTWQHALDFVAGINAGTYSGCGAGYTDWRLPNVRELESLIHYEFVLPCLSNTAGTGQWTPDDPFANVFFEFWSSTVRLGGNYVYYVNMIDPNVKRCNIGVAMCYCAVWPVRGGD